MKNGSVNVADRRDYVISAIANPIPISGGPVNYVVSLDTDYPHLWGGFLIGSIYSSTPSGGGLVRVTPYDLSLQIQDSNRNFLFSDYCPAAAFNFATTSSNIATGENRNEPWVLNPGKLQPAGGSILVTAQNANTSGTLFFELILIMYKVKADCLASRPPSKYGAGRNLFAMSGRAA